MALRPIDRLAAFDAFRIKPNYPVANAIQQERVRQIESTLPPEAKVLFPGIALAADSRLPTDEEMSVRALSIAPIITTDKAYQQEFFSGGQSLLGGLAQMVTNGFNIKNYASALGATLQDQRAAPPVNYEKFTGEPVMGLFDSLVSGVSNLFTGGTNATQSFGWNDVLRTGAQIGQQYANSLFVPQSSSFPVYQQASPAMTPAVIPTAAAAAPAIRSVATVGRGFFNRFPNLATGIQRWRNMGKPVTRAKLYSMLKRFGPEFLISGGILTAAAVNELMMAGAGTRRMNPGNAKALRRACRRVESFHKLCVRADKLRNRGRSRARK